MENLLNERQQLLYELIEHNSLIEHRTTDQIEICEKLPRFYCYNDRPNSSDKCPLIWDDINALNLSPEVEKIIITEKYVYHIGSETETKDFIRKYWNNKIAPALKRYWNFRKKCDLDGTGKLIDEEFVEAFNKYNIKLGEPED